MLLLEISSKIMDLTLKFGDVYHATGGLMAGQARTTSTMASTMVPLGM